MGKNTPSIASFHTKLYFVFDGMRRPFALGISGKHVEIHAFLQHNPDTDELIFNDAAFLRFTAQKIWIGKDIYFPSRDTDGNAFLFRLTPHKYLFVGRRLYYFEPEAEITTFVSSVNDDYETFPFALDTLNNAYLFKERVIVDDYIPMKDGEICPLDQSDFDPYEIYYSITNDDPRAKKHFKKIKIIH